MTRTRWTMTCAALLLGSTAYGQEPSPARDCRTPACGPQGCSYQAPSPQTSCPAQTAEVPRAPYYYELPQLLYPAKGPALSPSSNPVVWARLFEAVARNHADNAGACQGSCGPRDRVRRESRQRRMACELLKLYRLFYREGHYQAAEILANKALELDPSNVAAEHALTMAHLVNAAARDGAEECDVSPEAPRPSCGMCRPAIEQPRKTKASCACGAECKCCQDPTSPCACGDSCPCKKPSRRQRVSRARIGVEPLFIQQFVPAAPACCPGVPVPPQVMAQPAPGTLCVCPCMPGECCWSACPLPPGVTPSQVAVPERVPMPALCTQGSQIIVTAAPKALRTFAPIRIDVCGEQVHVSSPAVEACCDSVTPTPDGRALLEGNVCVKFRGEKLPAKILAARMIVDLEDGSYEVNPLRVGPAGSKARVSKPTVKVKPASCVCPVKCCPEGPCSPCCPCETCPASSCDRPCKALKVKSPNDVCP